MADRVERVTQTTEPVETAPVERPAERPVEAAPVASETRQVRTRRPGGVTVAGRVVYYIFGVLLVLLAFRFVLTLLGANASNGFANFIYSTSHPFVAPFFGLFGYDLRYGVSRFEVFTLVAMAVYALVAWGIVRLLTIGQVDRNIE